MVSQYKHHQHFDNILLKLHLIEIDANKGFINLNVDKNELEKRNKKLKIKDNDFGSGALWKFSQTVGSARFGAVTHPGAKKEIKNYSDI